MRSEQVPGVGAQPAGDPGDEAFRPDEAQRLRAMQADPQQTIEAGKMIHVGVRHEDVAHPHQLPGRQGGDVTEVEQQGTARAAQIEVDAGIRKRVVDAASLDKVVHARQRTRRQGRCGPAVRSGLQGRQDLVRRPAPGLEGAARRREGAGEVASPAKNRRPPTGRPAPRARRRRPAAHTRRSPAPTAPAPRADGPGARPGGGNPRRNPASSSGAKAAAAALPARSRSRPSGAAEIALDHRPPERPQLVGGRPGAARLPIRCPSTGSSSGAASAGRACRRDPAAGPAAAASLSGSGGSKRDAPGGQARRSTQSPSAAPASRVPPAVSSGRPGPRWSIRVTGVPNRTFSVGAERPPPAVALRTRQSGPGRA